MKTTNDFHDAKMKLESALCDFIKASNADDRDLLEELNEAVFNACDQTSTKEMYVEWENL